jgi:hypothetical protein
MRAIAALLGVCLLSACGPWLEDFDLRNSGRMSFDTVEGEKIYYRVGKTWSGRPYIHSYNNKPVEISKRVDGGYKDALRIARFVAKRPLPPR